MQFRFDEEANALYIAIRAGEVVRTIGVTDWSTSTSTLDGAPLGIEFVSADEFVPFLRRLHAPSKAMSGGMSFLLKVRELFWVSAA